MPLTEDAIRSLAARREHTHCVVTCYLDVDGRRHLQHADVVRELAPHLRRARAAATVPSVLSDLDRIEQLVADGIDRSRTRGLCVVACDPEGLFEVFRLPVPVLTRVHVGTMPALRQLERVVEEHEPIGVLTIDERHARAVVVDLGEVVEHAEITDDLGVPDHDRERSDRGRGQRSARLHAHAKRATACASELFAKHPVGRVLIGGSAEAVAELDAVLPVTLRSLVSGRVPVGPMAPDHDVRAAVLDAEAAAERAHEADLVAQLRERAATGDHAVAGLAPTLGALSARRAEHVLVSQAIAAEGWWCETCGHLALVGRACPACGAEMRHQPDVVETACDVALAHGCRVNVCRTSADLDVLGGIAAFTRF